MLFDHAWIGDYEREEFDDEDYKDTNNASSNQVDDNLDELYDEMDPDEIIGLGNNIEQREELEAEPQDNNDNKEAEPQDNNDDEEFNKEQSNDTNLSKDWSNESDENESLEDNEDLDDINPSNTTETKGPPIREKTTQTGRILRLPTKYTMQQCHLQTQAHQAKEYSIETAQVIAMTMCQMNMGVVSIKEEKRGYHFLHT